MSMDKAREALVFCDSLAQMLRSNDMAHWADNEVAFIKAALHPAPVVEPLGEDELRKAFEEYIEGDGGTRLGDGYLNVTVSNKWHAFKAGWDTRALVNSKHLAVKGGANGEG